ncbi:helix-turn-helix domain-containing protein [Dyella sedimenti]|uniref:helix-turn-helix domain-containing protein n=1 Tax=Dyella sedimenti TaxID=2919947 RepID=UPI001FAAEC87|nr:helix-turn-helix domain-containing protein [Dyella sedimenti]
MPKTKALTIKDVVNVQNDNLRTIGQKIIYLTIRNGSDENGWASVSLTDLARNTGLSRRGVVNIISRMKDCGLVESSNDHDSHVSKNKYRAITL